MRKTTAVASVLGLTALALAGCAAAPTTPEACGRDDASDAAIDAVKVSGEFGPDMEVDAPAPFRTGDVAFNDVSRGDGPLIESMQQGVALDLLFVDPATGAQVPMWGEPGSLTRIVTPSMVGEQMLPGLEDALRCASGGTRMVAAFGEDGIVPEFGEQLQQVLQQVAQQNGSENAEAPDLSSVVAVIDVNRVLPASAEGSLVYNAASGMPSVVRDPDGVPGVTIPRASAPSEQVTQTLIAGDGAEIAEGDAVTLQYTSVRWSSGSVTNSTWQGEAPETNTLDQLPDGFSDALAGATVGSQVLTVVPGEGGDATVSVIDVLGAVPAAE